MLFFPCLSIKAIISIAQSFVIFALLVHTTQAGVIKKRDLSEIETTTLSTRLSQNETDFKELKVAPTILTPLTNESATTKLKLQPVSSNNFGFEHSKEFSNNEILFNTALKQKELKSFNQTNSAQNEENSKPSSTREIETEIKPDREENNLETTTELKSHLNSEKEQKNQVSSSEGIFVKEEDKVLNNINEKLETLSPITTTTEFSSNAIKEEKIQKNVELDTEKKQENTKLTDRFKQLEFSPTEASQDNAEEHEKHKEHSESLENFLNTRESNPRPPSQILTELKLEMEATTETSKNLNGDQLKDQLMQETTETKQVVITELPLEGKVNQDRREQLTTYNNLLSSILNTHHNNDIKMEERKSEIFSHDSENKLNLKESATTIKPQIQETLTSSQDSLKPLINSTDILSKPQREEFLTSSQDSSKPSINSTSFLSKPQKEEITSLDSLKPFTSLINSTVVLSQGKDHLNSINDGLDREVLKEVTTVLPIITEKSSLAEGNKMEYARSMFNEELKEESSTLPLRADNEIFINTTPKPVVLSIKEGLKEVEKENLGESLRESNKENFQSNTEGLRETEKESIREGLKEVEKENLGESIRETNKENFQSISEGLRETDKESLRHSSKESFLEHQSSTEGLRDPAKEVSLRQSNIEGNTEHRFSTEGLNELAKEELKESLRGNNNMESHQSFTESLKEFSQANSRESLEENNKESVTKQQSLKEGNLSEHLEANNKENVQSLTESLKESNKENFKESFVNSKKESFTESSLESLNESNKNEVKDLTSKEKDLYVGEKKPKFINDNSTNAQQMNLPNNAEVWYLAAMKSLPKSNVTMETAPKHNNSTELKEENLQNTTYTLNTNSEKNLLDWSLIMQNKELATTARSQNLQEKSQDEEEDSGINQLTNEEKVSTNIEEVLEKGKFSETPQQSVTQPSIQSREDMINIKPLLEQQQEILEITTIMPNSTILSSATTDNTENDKIHMNNQIEISTSVAEFENNTSKSPSILTNQTSADIEPNLNEINLTSNQMLPHKNDELNITATESTTGNTNNVDANVAVDVAAAATTSTTTERALVTSTESTAGNNNNDVDMTTLEQNSIELTTLSSLVSAKQNASQFNNANVIEQQQQNNVISEESTQKVFEEPKKDTANILQKNNFQNIDLNTEIPTTTSEIPITTFRPKNLAITSTTTSIPPSVRQEIDQNGNEIVEKQSINALEEDRNNSKTIETHLSELENIETTTLETIKQENTTSSAKDDDKIVHEQIQKLDEGKITLTTQATPKLEEDVTIIGSPVKETKFEKDKEIETTTTTLKTPVVEKEQRKNVEESSTIATLTEEDKIETQTTKETEKELEKNLEKVTENPLNSHLENELTTMGSYPVNTTAKKENEEPLIKLLDDTSTTTAETISFTTTTTTLAPPTSIPFPTTTFSTDSIESSVATESSSSSSTTISPLPITTKIEEIYKVIHTSTTEAIQTTTSHILTETTAEEDSSYSSTTSSNNMIPITTSSPASTKMIDSNDIEKSLPTLTSIMTGSSGNMFPKNSDGSGETDVNVIIAITVSVIGVVALILLVGFLYIMRKRQKQTSFSNRCRPVSLDEYTIDNGSVGGSIRKSSALRSSKRTYGNLAFDDPSLRHNAMGVHELAKFVQEKLRIFEEFRDVPQITSRLDEVPQGCEDKNRYANVLPLPETRVILQRLNDDDKTEYINANYVTGPKDPPNYYIACQAPLDTTLEDFWRMIWEQQSRVIIQATDLIENGVEKCAEYLPPSVTLDNHSTFGDFQITLQNREVKDKYAISTILLKHVTENVTRELTHFWYKWPEVGVPAEEAPIIAMLLEARSSLISYAIEQANEDKEKSSTATLKSAEEGTANGTSPSKDSNGSSSANGSNGEINGNISMVPIKKTARNQGPLTIHCSPGTGRTGTIIACDIAIRSLETPKRTVDIPQIVFYVRRGRASAVLTKEQYEFIYKVANMYAAKISNPTNYN